MTVTEQISAGISRGMLQYEEAFANTASGSEAVFSRTEKHICSGNAASGNEAGCELAFGDNLEYMKQLIGAGYSGRFRLIYIDPPFFTKSKYNASVDVRDSAGKKHKVHHLAYDDRFERNLGYYIENMTARLLMMRDLLSDDGLIWVHLDWHSSHYIRLVMDEIFGVDNFVNEIIWSYKSGGSGKRNFARKHDTILVYSKTSKYYLEIPEEKSYNRGLKPYNFKGVEEYKDENGWYTLVNMKDVWNIDMVGRTSGERNGYATQKPLELMKRIVEASTEEGDLVGDFFCGSGSILEASEILGRRWIGCDNEEMAVSMAKKRLDFAGAGYDYCTQSGRDYRLGRADIDVMSEEHLENGNTLMRCRLTRFEPDIEMGYIQLNDREFAEDALKSDPTQFVDYIMADPDYNGSFTCGFVQKENFNDISFISHGSAAFIIVDVFGREYFVRTEGYEQQEQ